MKQHSAISLVLTASLDFFFFVGGNLGSCLASVYRAED